MVDAQSWKGQEAFWKKEKVCTHHEIVPVLQSRVCYGLGKTGQFASRLCCAVAVCGVPRLKLGKPKARGPVCVAAGAGSWSGHIPFRAAHCHAHICAATVFVSSFSSPLPPGYSNGVLKYPLLCYLLCLHCWDNTYFMDSWSPPPMRMGDRLEASHEPDVPCRACT